MQGIASAHYPRGSKQSKRERVERARMQERELGATLVERQTNALASEGLRWKGIVDGTEVRVSPRWKPSKRARQHYSRERKERMVQTATIVEPHKSDIALMAEMGTIHDTNDSN